MTGKSGKSKSTSRSTSKSTPLSTRKTGSTPVVTEQLSWSDWSKLEFPKPAAPLAPTDPLPPTEVTGYSLTSFTKSAGKNVGMSAGKTADKTAPSQTVTSDFPSATEAENQAVNHEPAILTVSALNKLIRRQLEDEFSTLWLRGEISNFKAHPSGHFYFSLKDKDAQISAVMFRGFNSQLRF